MLAVEYLASFSMIYLIIFKILNFEQKKQVRWLNLIIFILLVILDVTTFRNGHQLGVIGGIILSEIMVIGLSLFLPTLFVGLYSLAGLKSWRAWLSIVIAIYFSSFLTSAMQGFVSSLLMRLNLSNAIIDESTIAMSFCATLLFILYLLAKKMGLKINLNSLSKTEIVFINLFLAIFGFFLMFVYTINHHTHVPMVFNFVVTSSVIIGVYLVMYFATQRSIIFEISHREKQQEFIFNEQRQNYERMLESNEEISIFKHSIRDELLYLYDLLHNYDLEKANTYLDQMRGKLDVIEQNVGQDTGSKAVNASWYSLTSTKKYEEVEATWLGRLPIHLAIDDRDLVLLFSNLLNNAFEAARQAIDDKYVTVKIDEKENGLFVSVRNSYQGEIVEKLNGDFETTKEDKKNHGIGVSIIKNIVEKYCGKVKFSYSDGEFVVTIVFSADIFKT